MNDVDCSGTSPPASIEFQSFISPINRSTHTSSRSPHLSPHHTEQLIVYAAPIIQSQIVARCKETSERLKEIKKEKSLLITATNKPLNKSLSQHDDSQQ